MTLYTCLRKKKDKIMTLNDSPVSTFCHTHMETYVNGQPTDAGPFRFVDFWVTFFYRVTLIVNDGCPFILQRLGPIGGS